MSNLTLHLSDKADKAIARLREYYGVSTRAEIIRKALTLLDIATDIAENDGELLARKGDKESKIIIS